MAQLNRITRCPQWYELNLAALRPRELFRAGGIGGGLVVFLMTLMPRLLGSTFRTAMLFPAKVTTIWDVPLDEIEIPEELDDLGLKPICGFELPEFTGENATCVLTDRDRTTYCELIFVRAQGEQSSGIAFSSQFPGSPPRRVKTVQSWKTNPLDQPEGYYNQQVNGTIAQVYEAHRAWLAEFRERPEETSREHFFRRSHESHQELCEYYVQRRVWVEASALDVDRLFLKKGLRAEI